jgi:hypothetical protein
MGMRTKTAAMVVLVLALAIAGLTGCTDDDEDDTVAVGGGGTTDASDPGSDQGQGAGPGDQLALPEEEPTVRGVIISGDAGPELTEVEAASLNDDAYYAGAILSFGESVPILDARGEATSLDEVFDQPVDLWLDACAESYPVQCGVIAVQLVG